MLVHLVYDAPRRSEEGAGVPAATASGGWEMPRRGWALGLCPQQLSQLSGPNNQLSMALKALPSYFSKLICRDSIVLESTSKTMVGLLSCPQS